MENLELANVVLESIQECDDAEEFFYIARDGGVREYVGFMYPTSLENAREIMEFLCDMRFICFKIVEKDTEEMVGIILGEPLTSTILDVAYFIGEEYRGMGYCSSAVRLFEEYLREETCYTTMRFFIKEDNVESQGVMNKLGIPNAFGNVYMLDLD